MFDDLKPCRLNPFTLILMILVWSNGIANAAVDPAAAIVHMRKDCKEGGKEIANCVKGWNAIQKNRTEGLSNLTVKMGPGAFKTLRCNGVENLSIEGSGIHQTVLEGVLVQTNNKGCVNLEVRDLTVTDPPGLTQQPAPIYWQAEGSSTWTNVLIDGKGQYAWTETCNVTELSVHRWFNSTLKSGGKTVYEAACSENWFFGSELILTAQGITAQAHVIIVGAHNGDNVNKPEMHIYGGVLRLLIAPTVDLSFADEGPVDYVASAVRASTNAEVHIHGTGIDVIGNEFGHDLSALETLYNGKIHASQSSFVMRNGASAPATPGSSGTLTRIKNTGGTGTIRAPYTWEPEILGLGYKFASQDGQDMVTEMVCNNTVCEPHVLVYMGSCTSNGPWFDTATGACRANS